MEVQGKQVLKTQVKDDALKLEWISSDWEQWQELQNAVEFKQLAENINDSLNKAKEWRSKGKGKGMGNQ